MSMQANNIKKVFIVGGTGFIGKKLVFKLLSEKIEVTALVLPGEAKIFENCADVLTIEGDLTDFDDTISKIKDRSYDVFYNLAWIGVGAQYRNDLDVQIKNIQLAMNALKLSKEIGCRKIIFTGSVSEYAYAGVEINGKQLPCPSDFYAATKACVHIYSELVARQNEIEYCRLLIPSVYGPGRDDNNLISYAIKSLIKGETPSFTKLEQKWDYLYIDDLITALYLAGEKELSDKTYAVGTGIARQLCEYVEIIHRYINPYANINIGTLPYKTINIDNSIVDISAFTKDTGFSPTVSFEEGIKKVISWYKDNSEGE